MTRPTMMIPGYQPIPGFQPFEIVPEPGNDTLTYEQSAALMSDTTFRGRVKVACLSYATYIDNEPTGTPAHNARLRWAAGCFQNPDAVANTVASPTVMDPAVQTAGSAVTDVALQAAVQGVVDNIL